MKKYSCISLCAVFGIFMFSLLFLSCEKEGIFMPSERISNIYKEVENDYFPVAKRLVERWKWEKKKLSQISIFNEEGEISQTFTFHYDGNQLLTINGDNGEELRYYYEKGKLDKIQMVENEQIIGAIFVKERINKVISHFRIESYSSNNETGKNGSEYINPLSFAMRFLCANFGDKERENHLQKALTDQYKNEKSNENSSIDISLKYNLDNVAQEEWIYTDVSGNEVTQNFKYSYDSYYNPFSGKYITSLDVGFADSYSSNNITKISNVNTNRVTQYSYEYKDTWPIKKTEDVDSYKIIYHYEYE